MMVHEKFYILAVPLVLLLLLLYIFSLDKVILLITFLTPLAINYKDFEFGIGISLPTEPLMLGVLFIFIFRIFYDGGYNKKVLNHPVSIAIIIYLIWIFLTIFTSVLPLVSIKFFIAKLWFVIPFYFICVLLFKKFSTIKLFQWLYAIPLLFVVFYTLYNHSLCGFDKPSSNMVMRPFYNDHTAYGAILAMFIPVFAGFSLFKGYSKTYRFISLGVLTILIIGLIFSYSRAAWLSLGLTFFVCIIILLRIKFKWLLVMLLILAGLFYMFQFQFMDRLEKNKQDSSTDFFEHIQSISNISSDASNLERINRWNCAIRLFKEKPFFGWGPGTYQFMYAPFQISKEKTIISTNVGDMGNAHSEYIGPLSESGLFGMFTFIVIVITVMITGLRVYKYARSREVKMLSLVLLLGLFSYFTHGLLNNFLDSDKASVPFWGFIAILVTLDLYFRKSKPEELEHTANNKDGNDQ